MADPEILKYGEEERSKKLLISGKIKLSTLTENLNWGDRGGGGNGMCVYGGGVLFTWFIIEQCCDFKFYGILSLINLLVIIKRSQQNCCIAYLTAY